MAIRMTGISSGLDTDSIVQALVSTYSEKVDNTKKAQTKLSWTQDAWKTLNTKIYSFYTKLGNFRYSSAYNMKKTTVSDSTKATITASGDAVNGTQTLKIKQLAKSDYLTGGKITSTKGDDVTSSTTLSELGYTGGDSTITIGTGGNTTEIAVNGSTKISEVVSKLNSAGVSASFDATNGRIFVSAKDSGTENAFTLDGDEEALLALGLSENSEGAVRVNAQDAEIELNGATFTSSTNQFSINGLTINVTGVTGDADEDMLTITTDTDTQGLYDKIKDLLSEYNELINEMTKLYNADSAKGYEPLTDDEKEEMSESEIAKWEEKIKDSLLRRDTTLNSIMSTMTGSMSSILYMKDGSAITYNTYTKTYQVDSKDITDSNGNTITTAAGMKAYATANGYKTYSLSNFGIATLGYLNAAENEYSAYHIDGDEDDTYTSGNTDKLMAMLQSDPDTVIGFMKGLATNLYNSIDTKMRSTTLSSAYTVYNDKQMASEYSDYTDEISKWEEKLEDMEDYYYDKFSAMETALATLNNQTSSLSSLFGS